MRELITRLTKYYPKLKNTIAILIEITGGEPLVQKEVFPHMMKILCDLGYEVMIETGGSLSIQEIDKRVKVIMDLKCPSSKMADKNLYENISYLKQNDEIKFVIGNREDYDWSKNIVDKYSSLQKNAAVLFSNVFSELEPIQLAEWILNDNLKVRFQIQMHKYIWNPTKRGV